MEENSNTPESSVKSTIDAVTGLVQAVPVYQDALQPAAKEIGQSLQIVAKTVNIALAPIKALVWGYEQIEDYLTKRVTEKLKNVPEENIVSPPPQVAGPAVEALRYTGHEENLRELYANLLATAMDKETAHKAHPGYVEIIKNITPDEAILLQAFISTDIHPAIDIHAYFTDGGSYTVHYTSYTHFHRGLALKNPELVPAYLNNLCRLGVLEIPADLYLTTPNTYEPLENDSQLDKTRATINEMNRITKYGRKVVRLTSFGRQFVKNVVVEKK